MDSAYSVLVEVRDRILRHPSITPTASPVFAGGNRGSLYVHVPDVHTWTDSGVVVSAIVYDSDGNPLAVHDRTFPVDTVNIDEAVASWAGVVGTEVTLRQEHYVTARARRATARANWDGWTLLDSDAVPLGERTNKSRPVRRAVLAAS